MDRTSLGGQCRNEHKWIGPVWADSAGRTQVGRTGLGGQCRNEHKWVGLECPVPGKRRNEHSSLSPPRVMSYLTKTIVTMVDVVINSSFFSSFLSQPMISS